MPTQEGYLYLATSPWSVFSQNHWLSHEPSSQTRIASRHFIDGFIISMSRGGNCLDNAMMENFFATLQSEMTHHHLYRARAKAKSDIFYYIEAFYNRRKRHSTFGYKSPDQFEYHFQHPLN